MTKSNELLRLEAMKKMKNSLKYYEDLAKTWADEPVTDSRDEKLLLADLADSINLSRIYLEDAIKEVEK